jgi:enamidase
MTIDSTSSMRHVVSKSGAGERTCAALPDLTHSRDEARVITLVHNIGTLVSGDIGRPLLDADSLVIRDGRIAAIGRGLDEHADTVIDAGGTTVMPGLIDSHVHPVFGDFTPRQRTVDFIDSGMHGGVTTAISAGEVHLPGRPKDIVGLKALAIVAAKAYASFRPGGVKVHAGAPILELGMSEGDFAEMAAAGVRLVGEIGLGSVKTGKDAAPMVRWARAHGMTVTIHTGGPSIAGSHPINADVVLEADPDVVGHINGGTTSMTPAEIERLVATSMALEIVQCGNMKTALHTLRVARDARATHRLIVGNDAPSGTGVIPLGVLRTLSLLAGLGGLPPAEAIACATGNTARVYRLNCGLIAEGRAADLVVCDAPTGSIAGDALGALAAGDLPGISMVLIDGRITIGRSRNTPPAARAADVVKGHGPTGAGH